MGASEPAPALESSDIKEAFRRALRGVASTVTMITTQWEGRRYGMVATATMSVSFDPPSFVVAVNRSASAYRALEARGAFAVNIVGRADEHMARWFAETSGEERFQSGRWLDYSGNDHLEDLPYLDSCQAAIFCKTAQSVSFGTHTLFIGEVRDIHTRAQSHPLLYLDGGFGSYAAPPKRTVRLGDDLTLMPCPL
jgi:flavin reductase (DIM6/NTAB) family NADH-FMN oxidoreductase RutF